MPYSVPAQGRPGHRRSFSNIVPPPSLASTSTTGAFSSLGALPTRRRPTRPTFHLGREDDDDSPDESPEDPRPTKLTINTNLGDDDEHAHLPPLRLKSKFVSSFDNQQPASATAAVPFPRCSPLPSPTISERPSSSDLRLVRPSVSRTASTPILLANGKPLKSSLKSSSSSPNIPFPPQSLVPSIMFPQLHQHLPTHHQRACSAPATPNLDPASPTPSSSPSPSIPQSPTTFSQPQKNVHFPSQEEGGLTTVRVYKRSAKPASLLRKGDETETETEGESSCAQNGLSLPFVWGSRWNQTSNGRIPKFGSVPLPKKPSPLADHDGVVKENTKFEIDMKNSSPIPARGAERTLGNIFFETLGFICDFGADNLTKPLTLTGTVLVRNIAYHKSVTVRFTLDDWNTTNDVLARHEKSLSALPERFLLASLPLIEESEACPELDERRREVVCRPDAFEDRLVEGGGAPTWDRFRFEISLERYESSIQQRTMWFVGRYSTAPPVDSKILPVGDEEWWDNNSGNNYRVAFMKTVVEGRAKEVERENNGVVNSNAGYRRNVTFSAPPVFTPSKPFLAPPQISASFSYPVGMTAARREQAAASHAALTQRLKKFGFTNYAAPSPSGPSSLPAQQDEVSDRVSPSESLSTETSADSTPLQTPTHDYRDDSSFHFHGKSGHDVDANVLVHDDEQGRDSEEERRLSWGLSGSLQMQDGHPATFVPSLTVTDDTDMNEDPTPTPTTFSALAANPMEIGKGRGRATVEHGPSALEPTSAHVLSPPATQLLPGGGLGIEMGTSPPFSMLAGMELRNGMFASKENSGIHWPWSGESEKESREPTPTPSNIVAPTPTHVATNGADVRTSSPNQGLSGPLMPPQRKKSHQHSHSLPNKVATFSIGRSSSSSSRSGSGSGSSGSGSDTANGGRTLGQNGNLVSPQPWPLPPQNQLRRVMSPPPAGFASRKIFEIKGDDDDEAVAVNQPPAHMPTLPPPHDATPMELQSPANDAVYQAFVRQWCFAQGPAPNVGAGSPRKSERIGPLTPDVVVL